MKTNITSLVTKSFKKAKFKVQKHSPEILIVVGIGGIIISAVSACRATLKVNDILKETEEQLEKIHNCVEDETISSEEYSEADLKKDTTLVYVQTGIKVAKEYAPCIILGAFSIGCVLTSNNILKKRYTIISASYAAGNKAFKEYRKRVIEKFGEEVDKELRYETKAVKIEEETAKGKKKEKDISVFQRPLSDYSPYARFFDSSSSYWKKDPEGNLFFLRSVQAHANDLLIHDGYLFLNDVYKMLGLEPSKAGQVVGWIYDPKNPIGDNYVDFGIYDGYSEAARDFVNGYERTPLLDFNVDGNIWELM